MQTVSIVQLDCLHIEDLQSPVTSFRQGNMDIRYRLT